MKRLVVNPAECTHCRNCELACSYVHADAQLALGPKVIEVRRIDTVPVPLTCLQCDDPACVKACPVEGALIRDPDTQAIVVTDKCIGCKACVYACPFGAMYFTEQVHSALKCDLCGGDPACAKFCPTEALTWVEDEPQF